jgi:acyl-CoA thioesterase YciA
MVFHQPVFIGDEVSLYCDIIKVGRTSMTIRVEAWRRSRTDEARNKVTEATFSLSLSTKIENLDRFRRRRSRN